MLIRRSNSTFPSAAVARLPRVMKGSHDRIRSWVRCAVVGGFLAFFDPVHAAEVLTPPPAAFHPSAVETARLRDRYENLVRAIRDAEPTARPELVPDVAVFAKAVEYLLRYPEQFYTADYYANALRLVDEGLRRAKELAAGTNSWLGKAGVVCRGYRSAVDGSIQPYCVWVPESYRQGQPARLDVILHGRNRVLTEVSFLCSALDGKIIASETGRKGAPDCLKLYVFGRGNNSYRWAGESDVFEALASVRSRYAVDPERIVLRGFSMGGTGAWHLGLHFPSRWAAVEAGAGYVETRPEVRQTVHDGWRSDGLTIHDASNCALNMTDVPFVAYVGSEDTQREQNEIIRRNLSTLGLSPDALPRARFLIGDGFGHAFRPESKQASDALIDHWLPRRWPESFHFVAYTPAYGEAGEFRIDALEWLYQRAEIRGTADDLHTTNVLVLKAATTRTLTLDGQRLTGSEFHKVDGRWVAGGLGRPYKRAGLQGPIDDAFQQPFLCVNPDAGEDPALEAFRRDFARYLRGDIRIKRASEVTTDDVASYNLILFGDSTTNAWIRKVLPRLPLTWNQDEIRIGEKRFPAGTSTVALIHPNPENPQRYVVLNSGHTFPGKDFDDMHWYLHPRLADIAVLNKSDRAVLYAGYFDVFWQLGSAEKRR